MIDRMESLLNKASRIAEQADVFVVESEETPVNFEANRLKSLQARQSSSITVRVLKNGRMGLGVSTRPGDDDCVLEMALETAAYGQRVDFELPDTQDYPVVSTWDDDVPGVSVTDMVDMGRRMIDAVTSRYPDVLCDGGVDTANVRVRVMNTRGGCAEYRKTIMGIGLQGSRVRGTDMLFVGDGQDDCGVISGTDEIIANVLTQLERAEQNVNVRSGEMPVIFTPSGVASAFIPALGAALNGKLVLEGASPLAGKLGDKIFDPDFSLADDPTIAMRPTSRICDDEGIASRRTMLVSGGHISSFYYDLKTASRAGVGSTGNGSRGRGGAPAPSVSALVVTPGNTGFEEMLAGIKEGLVVEYLMGAEQGNVLGGDFSGNVLLGYKVENGQITGRVKDTVVAGNIYKLLKNITVGSDIRWQGGLYSPSIMCPMVSVASK